MENSCLPYILFLFTTHAAQGRAGLPPPLESSTRLVLETSYTSFWN